MLNRAEWAELHPFLTDFTKSIKNYRETHDASLPDAFEKGHQEHHDTLQPYIRFKLGAAISRGTVNRDLVVVRRILNLSARLWRDESDRPWLDTPALIQMQRDPNKREPYPLSIDEQRLLFSELTGHLARMARGDHVTSPRNTRDPKSRRSSSVGESM